MKSLVHFLNDALINDLKKAMKQGKFPGISFEQAMQFLLTDGLFPGSDLPISSFLQLEDWVHQVERKAELDTTVSYTTTQLKNKTGEILEQVSRGKVVRLMKHGRPIAEIKKI